MRYHKLYLVNFCILLALASTLATAHPYPLRRRPRWDGIVGTILRPNVTDADVRGGPRTPWWQTE